MTLGVAHQLAGTRVHGDGLGLAAVRLAKQAVRGLAAARRMIVPLVPAVDRLELVLVALIVIVVVSLFALVGFRGIGALVLPEGKLALDVV